MGTSCYPILVNSVLSFLETPFFLLRSPLGGVAIRGKLYSDRIGDGTDGHDLGIPFLCTRFWQVERKSTNINQWFRHA